MPHNTLLALDVGGTRLKGAILDLDGTVVTEVHRPTHAADGPDAAVASILELLGELRELPDAAGALAAGLAVPGIVDTATGTAVWSENLRWRDVPFRSLATERLRLPVAVGHDVRAGGLAETRAGSAQGEDNVLFVPIGTGISAAIVIDGRVVDGNGMAGELGHVDVGHEELCACGATGCPEAVASAAAIARRYHRRTGTAVDGAAEVLARKRAGDPVAAEVWEQAVDALGRAFAIACSIVAPDVIVLGGGLALAGPELSDPLARELSSRLTFQRMPRLVPAALGDRAGCIGAGMLARELLNRDHS